MAREAVDPDGLVDATSIGYSQAVVVDGTLFASGQVGWDADFEVAGEDVASQAAKAFENVEVLLSACDRSLADVAKVTAHLVDPDRHLDEFFDVWHDVFPAEPYPCLTILGVDSLAREEFLVEIEFEVPDVEA